MSRILTPQTLAFELTTASDPQISPDGTQITYTLAAVGTDDHRVRREVWMCGIDGTQPRSLTPGSRSASGARWSPDGASIAFAVTDENGCAIAVLAPGAPCDSREIARHTQAIDELTWSPNGRQIAYTTLFDPDNPNERPAEPGASPSVRATRRLDYKQDGRGYLGDRRNQVFVADIATAACRRLTSDPVDHDAAQWSPDGRSIGMRVHLCDRAGDQLVVLDVDSGETKRVGPGTGLITHWVWSPDGAQILVAADPDQSLQPDFYLHRFCSGTTERLTTDLRSAPEAVSPIWLDGRRVLYHALLAGASVLEMLDMRSGEIETIERPQARNAGLSIDRAARYVVQSESSLASVGEIRVFDRRSGQARTITQHNVSLLDERRTAAWDTFAVRRGEFEIDVWLLKPPDFDPDLCYPVILDVHGGPNANYGYGFLAHEQCLAAHGFLVVFANPRGSTSYGRHFAQQVVRDWGGEDYHDVMAALDEVLRLPYADADRTGIFGFSYGGYLTSWAIGHTNRFKAAVCGEPIFDLESDYGTSDVAFNGLERYGGGAPHEESEWYAAHSPSTWAHRTRTPTLIVHGEADARCPIGQSEQMFVALLKAGCETEFVRYPEGSHMFFAEGLPEHRADFLSRTVAWFKDHLA